MCSTCQKEVEEGHEALQCDIFERWEHLCIKVCHRPTTECYNVLCTSPSKALVFTCSRCRHRGTLVRRLQQAETALESVRVQIDMYERLLSDKQQQLDRVISEREVLQLEKEQLNNLLQEARLKVDKFHLQREGEALFVKSKADNSISSKTRVLTPPSFTQPSAVASSGSKKRELPKLPTVQVSEVEPAVSRPPVLESSSGTTVISSTVPVVTNNTATAAAVELQPFQASLATNVSPETAGNIGTCPLVPLVPLPMEHPIRVMGCPI